MYIFTLYEYISACAKRTLRLALYHELEDLLSDSEDYNLGYFEGKQQKNKWLVAPFDLEAMYTLNDGKSHISLWCDGKRPSDDDSSDDKQEKRCKRRKKSHKQTKLDYREDELESVFKQLKEKHQDKFSGPQLRLWACMIVAKTHDDLDDPPRVPMITGTMKRSQPKESLSDAFASAATAIAKVPATAIAKVLSPIPAQTKATENQMTFSPGKKLELRNEEFGATTSTAAIARE